MSVPPGGGVPRRTAILGGLSMAGGWGATGLLAGCEGAQAQSGAGPLTLELAGKPRQSGVLIGLTAPGAAIDVAGVATTAGSDGRFVCGFDRDAPPSATLTVRAPDGRVLTRLLAVEPRSWPVRAVTGLPAATVSPPPEAMARIARDSAVKQRAFESRDPTGRGFMEGFSWPLAPPVTVTSPWGAQRQLNGALQRPHYGIDLRARTGTPILAPASGLVILAEPDMHFEGGIVAIDHGQGLITTYLHQSRIDVRAGDRVTRGARLGLAGAKGRATGPHLCWRMRWLGRQLDPSLLVTT
jgi:hypothetical protein